MRYSVFSARRCGCWSKQPLAKLAQVFGGPVAVVPRAWERAERLAGRRSAAPQLNPCRPINGACSNERRKRMERSTVQRSLARFRTTTRSRRDQRGRSTSSFFTHFSGTARPKPGGSGSRAIFSRRASVSIRRAVLCTGRVGDTSADGTTSPHRKGLLRMTGFASCACCHCPCIRLGLCARWQLHTDIHAAKRPTDELHVRVVSYIDLGEGGELVA